MTWRQLRTVAGLSEQAIHRRTLDQRLHRVHRGVYAVGHTALPDEAKWLAAVLSSGPDVVLGHLCAARLWRIWSGQPGMVDVVSAAGRRAPTGVRVHLSRRLTAHDTTTYRRIPVTTVSRTLLDLGDVLTPHQLARVIDEAAFRRRLNRRRIADVLVRNRGRAAVTTLRRALDLHDAGSAGTRSDLEDEYLAQLAHAGAPTPLVNVPVAVEGGVLEVDFHWPDERLCVEVDGSGHDRAPTRREDRRRDRLLRRAGFEVLRCRPGELATHARETAELLVGRRSDHPSTQAWRRKR